MKHKRKTNFLSGKLTGRSHLTHGSIMTLEVFMDVNMSTAEECPLKLRYPLTVQDYTASQPRRPNGQYCDGYLKDRV
jgi:hypothetical protein